MYSSSELLRDKEKKPDRSLSEQDLADMNEMYYGNFSVDAIEHAPALEKETFDDTLRDPEAAEDEGVVERNLGGIDMQGVDGALSGRAREALNVVADTDGSSDLRRQHTKSAVMELQEGTIENESLHAQQEEVIAHVEALTAQLGGQTDNEMVQERFAAGVINAESDGRNETDKRDTELGTQDLREIEQAAVGNQVLESLLEGNTESLNRLERGAADKVVAWTQGVRERGGPSHVSNEELAWLGDIIAQGTVGENTGEMLQYTSENGEVREVEKNNRLRTAAIDWLDGNINAALSATSDISHETNDRIYYYLETVREQYDTKDKHVRDRVIAEIQRVMLQSRHDSDR